MRVSVVICTCQGQRFIAEQLDSILAQTVLPFEVVVSDDASSDGTYESLLGYESRFAASGVAWRLHRQGMRLGVTRNFEFVCLQASGDLLVFCDQDDRWLPNRISEALGHFEGNDALACLNSDALIIDGSGNPARTTLFKKLRVTPSEESALRAGDLPVFFPYRNLHTGATMTIRRAVLGAAIPFPSEYVHDEWLALVSWLTGDVRTEFKQLIEYRLHEDNFLGVGSETSGSGGDAVPKRVEDIRRQIGRLERALILLSSRAVVRRDRLQMLSDQCDHLKHRLAVSESKSLLYRFRLAYVNYASGGYSRFAQGWKSAAKDIFG